MNFCPLSWLVRFVKIYIPGFAYCLFFFEISCRGPALHERAFEWFSFGSRSQLPFLRFTFPRYLQHSLHHSHPALPALRCPPCLQCFKIDWVCMNRTGSSFDWKLRAESGSTEMSFPSERNGEKKIPCGCLGSAQATVLTWTCTQCVVVAKWMPTILASSFVLHCL
ncbi:hypothetical protein B0H12DRAFT_348912 [Mycena haematopus]|nr:hypothetical protein B0H12DRAFT_348912 [Mycena haematopus]